MSNPSMTWKSQAGYVWSLIGSVVGFANILSFSAQVYRNGGGAFLIPYCIALFLLGIPLLLLEGCIGHHWKLPLVSAYGRVWKRIGKSFGWLAVIACLTIGGFYTVLTGYSVAYTYFSAAGAIPEDSKSFFLNDFLHATPGVQDFGSISITILIATGLVLFFAWWVLVRNVRDGIEKVCTICMPLLAVVVVVFAVCATLLPGGAQGWVYYLKPDFSKLFDASLWRDVFGQLFFSLSLGLGIVVGYSRHTGESIDVAKSMMWVALGDFAVSFISGSAIFGCLAHISYVQGVPFDSILTTDSTFEIGFILFPQILQFFGDTFARFIGTIFFFCIFIAGITGVFSIIESVAGNIEVEFKKTRKQAVTIAILLTSALVFPFCMGNANHLIDALAPMVIGTNMLIGGVGLVLAFAYSFSLTKKDTIWPKSPIYQLYGISLRYIAPLVLGTILIASMTQEWSSFDIAKGIRWSWLAVAIVASIALSRHAKQEDNIITTTTLA